MVIPVRPRPQLPPPRPSHLQRQQDKNPVDRAQTPPDDDTLLPPTATQPSPDVLDDIFNDSPVGGTSLARLNVLKILGRVPFRLPRIRTLFHIPGVSVRHAKERTGQGSGSSILRGPGSTPRSTLRSGQQVGAMAVDRTLPSHGMPQTLGPQRYIFYTTPHGRYSGKETCPSRGKLTHGPTTRVHDSDVFSVHLSFPITVTYYISLLWCLPRYFVAFQGQYSAHIAFLVPCAYAAPTFDPVTARLVFPWGETFL